MKNLILTSFLILAAFSPGTSQDYQPGYVLAKFKKAPAITENNEGKKEIPLLKNIKGVDDLILERHLFPFLPKGQKGAYEDFQNIYSFSFDPAIPVFEKMEVLMATGIFEYVEPEYIGIGAGQCMDLPPPVFEPNDPNFSRQWNMRNDGTFNFGNPVVDADTDMEEAWNITTGSEDVTIAILDSGFKMDHPELSGRFWQNPNEIPGNGIDDDFNGYVDDINGWDFVNLDGNPTDDHGHGTNVAGIAVATGNNSIGYAGVDWNCKVMICKILDFDNSGFLSVWAEAVMYAVENGADVINMSVGGSGNVMSLRLACEFAHNNGIPITVSMMNFNNNTTYYPAGYPTTIGVGSTDMDDTRTSPFFWNVSSGSNYGQHIDVVAPGNYIYGLAYNNNNNYNTYWGGTSQAAPLVAGLCGLLLAQNPDLSPEDIRQLLHAGAEDQVGDGEDIPGFDIYYGHGRVNAYNTLLQLTNTEETESDYELVVFPNPVTSPGEVRINIPDGVSIQRLQLKDIGGKIILQQEFEITGEYTLKIPPQIPQGLYLAELFGSGVLYNAKIKVQ